MSHCQASYEWTYCILGLNERIINRDDLYVTMLHAVVVSESALLSLAEKQLSIRVAGHSRIAEDLEQYQNQRSFSLKLIDLQFFQCDRTR